ncbi:receptor-like protein 12 [Dioscorea cayenensis subsp. rotundata]|uniref:Receptor-like protein 12 n=1 Tax=Dioscorea cayennensis subsp. rotundata TaxID=55577 RepID=A0AB40C7Q0_DIOCR|nr:receptor-like protein 12 [Dioscorea cayenensis subsp. rotundata]
MPFITGTITTSSTGNTTRGCIKAERDALLAFKAELMYHKAHPISSWGNYTDIDCCQWAGVHCDNNSGHIVRLDPRLWRPPPNNFDDYNYYVWCDDESGLSGNISESLLGLKHLTYLDLSFNCFLNISIPKFLSSLENLVHLDLSYSGFTGVIPYELGNLTKLSYLNLANYDNKVDDAEWLSGLSSLRYFMNIIPESLPYLNFTSLSSVDIRFNKFDNTSIPEWLFRIPNLRHLTLTDCGFTGTIPSSIRNATSLQMLSLALNKGISGDIPRGFGDLCNLQELYLSGTFVGKSLEDFKDAFSGCIRRNLNVLTFEFSWLQGPLPDCYNFNYHSLITEAHLANLTGLKYLILHRTNLVLNISTDWIPGFQAFGIYLSYCHIGPKFPVWLANQVNLASLEISNSGIKDSMPNWFWNITGTMISLDLSNNEIKGRMPQRFKFQAEEDYAEILLSSNHFEGSIPYFSSNVYALDLSNNSFSGIIPSDLGNFVGVRPRLTHLSLSSNNLTGGIPNSLCNFMELIFLELSNNHLEGVIPSCWNNLTSLQYLILANNSLSQSEITTNTSQHQGGTPEVNDLQYRDSLLLKVQIQQGEDEQQDN